MTQARTVLVTGCSSGIGLACAQGLKGRGWRVFATARRDEDLDRLGSLGLEPIRLELADPRSVAECVVQVLDRAGGRLDAIFNNGAYGQPGAVEDISRDCLRAQLETNLLGWHDLTRRVIPVMRAQGQGRIVHNSSVLGLVALPYRGAYVASKFALEGLTDTLRLELRGSGIRVSLIEPGPILSRFRDNAHRAFKAHIDADSSVHREAYARAEARLTKEGAAQPFTLPPDAVLKALVHALESPKPRARYYVTFPTHLLGTLKRLLPTEALDWVLTRISGGGTR